MQEISKEIVMQSLWHLDTIVSKALENAMLFSHTDETLQQSIEYYLVENVQMLEMMKNAFDTDAANFERSLFNQNVVSWAKTFFDTQAEPLLQDVKNPAKKKTIPLTDFTNFVKKALDFLNTI